jgi:hypothetical protein
MILPVFVFLAQAAAATPAPKHPATDLSLHTVRLPGIGAKFVDWHWQPELFEAMEKGSSTMPEAQRNWMLARIVTEAPFTLEGKKLVQSNYALALWPNLDGKGWTIELRRVDMRTVLVRNVMAELPKGETIYRGPANFETTPDTAARMDVKLVEGDKAANLELRYGNRKLVVAFGR